MRVLVFGASGMLGSALMMRLADQFAVIGSVRTAEVPDSLTSYATIPGVDVRKEKLVADVISEVKPDVIINAAGVVKQRPASNEIMIRVNALFPQRLAELARVAGARLIHISTDCVFSGMRGGYNEGDQPDPVDIYGMSKLLGEPIGQGVTVLRSSMIGLEPTRSNGVPTGLIGWYLDQQEPVNGYRQAIFSGLTVTEMTKAITTIIEKRGPEGLWHVAAEPISKHDLLSGVSARLGSSVQTVRPVDVPAIDRSLDGSSFQQASGYSAPPWNSMLDVLCADIEQMWHSNSA